MNTTLFAIVVIATFLATNIIAATVRGTITSRIYGADPNAHGWLRISLSLIGTIVGGGMFLAVGQIGFEAGVVGYCIGLAYLAGFVLVAVLSTKIRQTMDRGGHDTLIDLLESKYSRGFATHFALINFLMYLFLLSAQLLALYSFARYASTISQSRLPWMLIGLGIISMLLYTVVGGLRKDIWADIVQVAVITIAAGFFVYAMMTTGAVTDIFAKVPPSHLTGLDGKKYGWVFLAGLALFVPPSFLVRMDLWQRIRAASSARASSIAFLVAGVGSLMFYALFTTLGMWALVDGGHKGETATLEIITSHFTNRIVLGILVGALFAAVLSTADVFVNICSLFVAKMLWADLWSRARGDVSSDRALLTRERLGAVAVCVAAILIAWRAGDLVDLLVGALSILLIYLAPILGCFVEKWRSTRAAFVSSSSGLAVFLILFFSWNPKLAFAPAVIIAWISHWVVLLWRRRRMKPGGADKSAVIGDD